MAYSLIEYSSCWQKKTKQYAIILVSFNLNPSNCLSSMNDWIAFMALSQSISISADPLFNWHRSATRANTESFNNSAWWPWLPHVFSSPMASVCLILGFYTCKNSSIIFSKIPDLISSDVTFGIRFTIACAPKPTTSSFWVDFWIALVLITETIISK